MRWAMVLAAVIGWSGQATALGRLADVKVMDRTTGSTLRVYEHRGKHYIVGEPGHEYSVTVSNREGARVMAVGSVDGVNIVSGETAAVDQGGYVLSPWQDFTINGWRTSQETTAAFYFTTVKDSYAARTGRPDDLGVIGFAFFREKARCCEWQAPPRIEEQRARPEAQTAAPAAKSQALGDARESSRDDRIGTGYGREEYSYVDYTHFEPASSSPSERVTLYYDSYENLRRKGVIPRARWQPREPRPFPGGHFVPAP